MEKTNGNDVEEKTARAVGRDLNISTKQSIEICSFIRNRDLKTAKGFLQDVMKKERAVPHADYNSR